MYRNPKRYKDGTHIDVMLNHLEHNNCLVTKKGLYFCLKAYSDKNSDISLLSLIPRTYYLKDNLLEPGDLPEFLEYNRAAFLSSSLIEASVVLSDSFSAEEKSFKNEKILPTDNHSLSTINIRVVDDQNEPIKAIKSNHTDVNYEDLSCAADDLSTLNTPMETSETIITLSSDVHNKDHLKSTKNVKSNKVSKELIWILKPASKTNRGFGITVVRGVQNVLNVVKASKVKKNSANTISKSLKTKKENPETNVSEKNEKGSILSNAANRLGAQEG